jgi:hypothetical protein
MARLGMLVVLAWLAPGRPEPADAQASGQPTIEMAATISADSDTQIPFPIRVGPAAAIPRNSFVRVRGLPPMAALSEGHSIGPGSWAIPLAAAPTLEVALPVTAVGRADVSVSLVTVDGSVLVEVKSTLIVNPQSRAAVLPPGAQSAAGTAPALAPPQPMPGRTERGEAPRIAPPTMLAEDRERALRLLQRGHEQLAQGLIAPARLLYERAADLGLAQAALALGATYDAAELTSPHLRGVGPDAREARRWYERARQLGASEADLRLRRLGAN